MLHKLTNRSPSTIVLHEILRDEPAEIPAGEARLVDLARLPAVTAEISALCEPATAEDRATVLPLYPTTADWFTVSTVSPSALLVDLGEGDALYAGDEISVRVMRGERPTACATREGGSGVGKQDPHIFTVPTIEGGGGVKLRGETRMRMDGKIEAGASGSGGGSATWRGLNGAAAAPAMKAPSAQIDEIRGELAHRRVAIGKAVATILDELARVEDLEGALEDLAHRLESVGA